MVDGNESGVGIQGLWSPAVVYCWTSQDFTALVLHDSSGCSFKGTLSLMLSCGKCDGNHMAVSFLVLHQNINQLEKKWPCSGGRGLETGGPCQAARACQQVNAGEEYQKCCSGTCTICPTLSWMVRLYSFCCPCVHWEDEPGCSISTWCPAAERG